MDKVRDFFKALRVLTKSDRLQWERAHNAVRSYQADGDPEVSYLTTFDGQPIVLVCAKSDGRVSCFIEAWGLPPEQVGQANAPELLKLYNLINGVAPSVEGFMEAVILEAKTDA